MGARGPAPKVNSPVIFPPGVPEPSERLDGNAKAEYIRVRDLCKQAGRELQQVDMAILEAYAQAFSDYWRNHSKIMEEGDTLSANNGIIMVNPRCKIRDSAWKQLLAAAAKLGLSPADRPRIAGGGGNPGGQPSPLDTFG